MESSLTEPREVTHMSFAHTAIHGRLAIPATCWHICLVARSTVGTSRSSRAEHRNRNRTVLRMTADASVFCVRNRKRGVLDPRCLMTSWIPDAVWRWDATASEARAPASACRASNLAAQQLSAREILYWLYLYAQISWPSALIERQARLQSVASVIAKHLKYR